MDSLNCPYCHKEQNYQHEDGRGYEEDVKHEQICESCEKTFVFKTVISFSYESSKADCLNDESISHNYELTKTFPKEASKMRCTVCDKERNLTDEERLKFGIGTVAEYIKTLYIKRD